MLANNQFLQKNWNSSNNKLKNSKKSKTQKKWINKTKSENAIKFAEQKKEMQKNWKDKAKFENPEEFAGKKQTQHAKWREKAKIENPQKFKENKKVQQKKWQDKAISDSTMEFDKNKRTRQKKWQDKMKKESALEFDQKKRVRQAKWQNKAKSDNLEKFKEGHRKREQEYYRKNNKEIKEKRIRLNNIQKEKIGSKERLKRFREKTQYGPIFVCSSCHQKLFEHEVVQLEKTFQDEVNRTYDGASEKYIDHKVPISLFIKEGSIITRKESNYICKSCKRFISKGKMPKLNKNNGLKVYDIPEHIPQLTELESNLIANNLIFQKHHTLPKSRWNATHDRLVNVPVHDDDIPNTIEKLPRTPSEAGIVSMPITANLKRKMEYRNTHIQQLINPANVYKYLEFLKESGHPGYQFYEN